MTIVNSFSKIAALKPGDHLCFLYETEEEHQTVLTFFLRQGLERGEKVLYFADSHTAEAILGYLRSDGVAIENYLSGGQLTIITADEIVLQRGTPDQEKMLALLQGEMERAQIENYPALRVTAEMSALLPYTERLLEYETKLNGFFYQARCLGLCQYDRRLFGPEILLDVLRAHPIALVGKEVCDNIYYIPTTHQGSGEPAAELQQRLQILTDRKRAEDALAHTQKDLRDQSKILQFVLESMGDGVIVVDEQGKPIFSNPAAEQILRTEYMDAPLEEWGERYGLHMSDMVTPYPEDKFPLLRTLQAKTEEGAEIFMRHEKVPEGAWLGINAIPLKDESGALRGGIAIFKDITERRTLEEMWRRFEFIVNTSKDFMTLIDKNYTYAAVNDAYCKARARKAQEIIGTTVADIWGEETFWSPIKAYLDSCFAGNEEHYQAWFEFAALGMRCLDVAYYPYCRDGVVTHAVVVSHDITERKQAEEELRKAHDELEKRVAERTAEIAKANEELRNEIAERKRAEEELTRRVRQLIALSEASQTVTSSLELAPVLNKFISLAREVTDSDYTGLVLIEEDGRLGRSAEIKPEIPYLADRVRDAGYTNWIIRSHQPIVVDDVSEDGQVISPVPEGAPTTINSYMAEVGIRSFIGLPLIARDRMLGVLYLHSLRPANFRGQLSLLTTFANQVAVAIENARLYQQTDRKLQTKVRELATLYSIAEMMNQSLDLDAILKSALNSTVEVATMDLGWIMLLNQSTNEFYLKTHRGCSPELIEAMERASFNDELIPLSLNSVTVIDDLAGIALPQRAAIEKEGIKTLLGIPLKAKENIMGVMILASHTRRPCSREELNLLAAISNQLVMAVYRARLQAQELRAAILEERQDMARQMHDDIAQTLGYLGLQVDNVMDTSSLAQNLAVQAELEMLRKAIEDAYERVCSSISRLSEDVPVHFDLETALSEIINEFEMQTGRKIKAKLDGGQLPHLLPPVALQATYIIREALANVRKHSSADFVHLTVQSLDDKMIEITIQDNGQGFSRGGERHSRHGGFGLRFMRERAERVGGSLRIESQPGQGTRVIANLPSG